MKGTEPVASSTTRPGQVVVSSSSAPPAADLGEARVAVDGARGRLPYPDDVLACVAVAAAGDGALLEAVRASGDAEHLARVQEAAAACVVQVRTAPRFAEDLQRASGGKLSEEQVACAVREFGELTPDEVEAASGAVLNPEQAEASATAPVVEIYETCGIERGAN